MEHVKILHFTRLLVGVVVGARICVRKRMRVGVRFGSTVLVGVGVEGGVECVCELKCMYSLVWFDEL